MKNTIIKNGISLESLKAIRTNITINMVDAAFIKAKKLDRWSIISRITFNWFLENKDMDDHLVEILNKLKDEKNLEGALNSMAIRMKLRKKLVSLILDNQKSIYALEICKLTLSASIIDALGQLGELIVEIKDGQYKNPINGRIERYESNWYLFQEKEKEMFDPETGLCEGLHLEPGELGGRKINVMSWERDVKFNKEQKDMLRQEASYAMRLIRKDKAWWTARFMADKWFIKSLSTKQESRASLKDRVSELVTGIMKLTKYDKLYNSYTYQVSGRFQAICNVEGIAPQGSGKYAWERSEPTAINLLMKREARIDATKLWLKNTGVLKPSIIDTQKAWKSKRKIVLAWLLSNNEKMSFKVYLEGLSEILVEKCGFMTHKTIMRDLSTNGVAVFSSNYKDVTMADLTNIAGSSVVNDPHQIMADMLGYESRKAMKDTGISAGLFHGQSIKSIAKSSGMNLRELIVGLNNVFGTKWRYFNRIANYVGKNLITNMNTSTRMKSPEGWYFINQSYAERTEIRLTIFSLETDSNIRSINVIRSMPILFNDKGFPMNNLYKDQTNPSNNGKIKMSGSYANSIHMLDAWMLRQALRFIRKYVDENEGFHHVHDNFNPRGDLLIMINKSIIASHIEMSKYNYLQGNINYMIDQSKFDLSHLALHTGDLTSDQIRNSTEFLQP